MDRNQIAMVWAKWAQTSEGRRCTNFSTLQDTGISPENRFHDRLWMVFLASAKLVLAQQPATPSNLEPDLDELWGVIERLRQRVHDQTNQTPLETQQIECNRAYLATEQMRKAVLKQIHAHGCLPVGLSQPIEKIVGVVLARRNGEIKRLKRELAEAQREDLDGLTCGIPSEVYAGIQVNRYETQYDVALAVYDALSRGQIADLHSRLLGNARVIDELRREIDRQKAATPRSAQDVARDDSDS